MCVLFNLAEVKQSLQELLNTTEQISSSSSASSSRDLTSVSSASDILSNTAEDAADKTPILNSTTAEQLGEPFVLPSDDGNQSIDFNNQLSPIATETCQQQLNHSRPQ